MRIEDAIKIFYRNGYITEEEAKALEESGWTYRNDCTIISISKLIDGFTLNCYEINDFELTQCTRVEDKTLLFRLSLNMISGIIRQTY